MELQTLRDLYIGELRDLYSAEKQIIEAMPNMIKAASNEELKAGFAQHLEETKAQAVRLEELLSKMGETTRGPKCKGIEGVLAEGTEMIEEGGDDEVRDAGLVAAAQRVEHYEIAGYSCARTYAKVLGDKDGAEVLQQTLYEEVSTDKRLAELANVVLEAFTSTPLVNFGYGVAHLKESLTQSMAEHLVDGGEPKEVIFTRRKMVASAPAEPRPAVPKTATDALGEAREVIATLRPLLAPSGRLSAPKVAALFGLSTAKLGRLIGGSSRQALAKTPDAAAIQEGLRPFERVARLRAILSEADFRAWLERSNRHLDEQTPLQIIESGRAGVVADLVESMLTGSPS
jgi:ferritin-like metal-binding protein YciE